MPVGIIWFRCSKISFRAEGTANMEMLDPACNFPTALKYIRFVLTSKLKEKTILVQDFLTNLGGMPVKIFSVRILWEISDDNNWWKNLWGFFCHSQGEEKMVECWNIHIKPMTI